MDGKDFEYKIDRDLSAQNAYIKLNDDFAGYFRVSYPASYLQRFTEDFKSGKLSEINRLGLLGDLVASAQAGLGDVSVAMELAASCRLDKRM